MALRKQHFHDDDEDREQVAHADKRSRLTFDINPALRGRIRTLAAQTDPSIGEYLEPFLEQHLPQVDTGKQRRPATRKMLEDMDKVQVHIMQERHGKPLEASAEMIRQMRDERA